MDLPKKSNDNVRPVPPAPVIDPNRRYEVAEIAAMAGFTVEIGR